jgi:hypothetical protein
VVIEGKKKQIGTRSDVGANPRTSKLSANARMEAEMVNHPQAMTAVVLMTRGHGVGQGQGIIGGETDLNLDREEIRHQALMGAGTGEDVINRKLRIGG